MSKIKRIGVLTSGGDSPGMNAAVRAIVRAGCNQGLEVFGIYDGYSGMMNGKMKQLGPLDVSGIIQRGGTILRTARCLEFLEPEGRKQAYDQLKKHQIDGVIVVGGDGSFKGANRLAQEFDLPVIGVPGTIDNDIMGTDYTIGFDTALNTVVEAVDKLKDTASSHNRVFFVEVMGREAGFLALRAGIACGAEEALIPEVDGQIDKLIATFQSQDFTKPNSSIVLVAEGETEGNVYDIADKVKAACPELSIRVSILGHIQRGGAPSCTDRVNASRMGVAAVKALVEGNDNVMIGMDNDSIVSHPIENSIKQFKPIWEELYEIQALLV